MWIRSGGGSAWIPIIDTNGLIPDATLPTRLGVLGMLLPSNDFNSVTASGWYWNDVNAVNTPPSGGPYWGIHVINIGHNPGYCTQMAYDYSDNTKVWKRLCYGGVWGAWAPFGAAAGGGSSKLAYVERTAAFTTHSSENDQMYITAPSLTFDGATEICIEGYVPGSGDTGGNALYVTLFDNGANIGRIAQHPRGGIMNPKRYLTPSSGNHVYALNVWTGYAEPPTNGVTLMIGPGGSGQYGPGFLRITK
jgi:hypothetical protein